MRFLCRHSESILWFDFGGLSFPFASSMRWTFSASMTRHWSATIRLPTSMRYATFANTASQSSAGHTKIAECHSPTIFHLRRGIGRKFCTGDHFPGNFPHESHRENRRSLAIFNRWALNKSRVSGEQYKSQPQPRRFARFWCTQIHSSNNVVESACDGVYTSVDIVELQAIL